MLKLPIVRDSLIDSRGTRSSNHSSRRDGGWPDRRKSNPRIPCRKSPACLFQTWQSVYQRISAALSRAFFAALVSSFNLNRSQFRDCFLRLLLENDEPSSRRKDDRYGNLRSNPYSAASARRVETLSYRFTRSARKLWLERYRCCIDWKRSISAPSFVSR